MRDSRGEPESQGKASSKRRLYNTFPWSYNAYKTHYEWLKHIYQAKESFTTKNTKKHEG